MEKQSTPNRIWWWRRRRFSQSRWFMHGRGGNGLPVIPFGPEGSSSSALITTICFQAARVDLSSSSSSREQKLCHKHSELLHSQLKRCFQIIRKSISMTVIIKRQQLNSASWNELNNWTEFSCQQSWDDEQKSLLQNNLISQKCFNP